MALNAVDEPIFIRLRRHEMVVVTMIEMSGIFIRGSTCTKRSDNLKSSIGVAEIGLTMLSCFEKGSPRSLANAQVILDDEVREPIVADMPRTMIKDAMAVPPLTPILDANISMKGYLVGVSKAASGSPRQNRTAISMPNPRKPFISMLASMDRGTLSEGF